MFPRAAVSRYRVNKFGKSEGSSSRFFFARRLFPTDFSVKRKTQTKSKKAGAKAGLLQFRVEGDQ
jgi:hypothetical protein